MNIPKFSKLWFSICAYSVSIPINERINFSCPSSGSCLVFPYKFLWNLFYILYGFFKHTLHLMFDFVKLSEPVLGSQTEAATTTIWHHGIPSSSLSSSSSSHTAWTHGSSEPVVTFFFFFFFFFFLPFVIHISISSSHFWLPPFFCSP